MKHKYLSLAVFLFAAFLVKAQSISTANIKATIYYLADEKLQGRGTSSPGEKMAADYIAGKFKEYKLTPKGDSSGSYYFHFHNKYNSDKTDTVPGHGIDRTGMDVVGYLDEGAENTIVIGAHLDHLGLGYDKNSLDANPEGKIHPGADDNASGVAGVLELARYYTTTKQKLHYNYLFICFSGEELGLFGSKKYCENPTIDLSKVDIMLNMDMIGRLNDSTKKLIVYGVGTAPDLVPMIDSIPTQFSIKKDSAGIGPSDQTSFYLKNVPVIFFFTGQHADYHKPTDVASKINYDGEKMVLEYILKVLNVIDGKPKLKFLTTKNPEMGRHGGRKITMGVMPDYTFEGKGMKVDGVTEGKPAFKAGIQKGDIVIQLGNNKIGTMMDYMNALGKFNKGDTTTVIVIRDGKEVTLSVTF